MKIQEFREEMFEFNRKILESLMKICNFCLGILKYVLPDFVESVSVKSLDRLQFGKNRKKVISFRIW